MDTQQTPDGYTQQYSTDIMRVLMDALRNQYLRPDGTVLVDTRTIDTHSEHYFSSGERRLFKARVSVDVTSVQLEPPTRRL